MYKQTIYATLTQKNQMTGAKWGESAGGKVREFYIFRGWRWAQ